MREDIEFRGKRLDNGEWAYGGIAYKGNRAFIITICEYRPDTRDWEIAEYYERHPQLKAEVVEVDPDTVGQYIGIEDKTGKKIFEGDVVKTQPFSDRPYSQKAKFKEQIGVVEYKVLRFRDGKGYKPLWDVNIPDLGDFRHWSWSRFWKCEVLGNRWDNPELLEEVR